MHESVQQVRKTDLQSGCQQVRQRERNVKRWRRNRCIKNMDVNCVAGARVRERDTRGM